MCFSAFRNICISSKRQYYRVQSGSRTFKHRFQIEGCSGQNKLTAQVTQRHKTKRGNIRLFKVTHVLPIFKFLIILVWKVVPPGRFERPAHGLGIRCSILLSYRGSHDLATGCGGLTFFERTVNRSALHPIEKSLRCFSRRHPSSKLTSFSF